MVSVQACRRPPTGWWYPLTDHLLLTDRLPQVELADSIQVMVIDSAGAFPLGHPTTRLCLDLLVHSLAAAPVARFVEIGCGSGVLCLAAAALGVPLVLGLDLAAKAVKATRRNARCHGQAVQVIQGSSDCLRGSFDLVVANLPIAVQHEHVEKLLGLTESSGRLLLSGFRETDEPALLDRYQRQGWHPVRRAVKYFTHPELPPGLNFNWVAWLLAAGEQVPGTVAL